MLSFSRGALGAAAFALCAVSTAPANAAGCWTQAEVSAAKVHEMQPRLMVAAQGCQASGVDIRASYDKFIATKRSALSVASDRLKGHFLADDMGYDRYTTALEQAYGAAVASRATCEEAADIAREAAVSKGDLTTVAARLITVATLPSAVCRADAPIVVASR